MSRNILEIYQAYKIMPKLQIHQLRVASVAKKICDSCNLVGKNVDTSSIVKACLLHDMGNIIKFDLTYFPDFTQPEGIEYWQKIKEEYINKYGNNEHNATGKIVREINAGEKVESLLALTGFSKVLHVLNDENLEKKICNYADMRVGPYGILSVSERTEDGRKRQSSKTSVTKNISTDFDDVVKGLFELEKQIFLELEIQPDEINDLSVKNIIEELKEYEI